MRKPPPTPARGRQVSRPEAGAFLFRRLHRRARKLEWFLFGLVAVVALVPSAVFGLIELHHLRERVRTQARHCGAIVERHVQSGQVDLDGLTRSLREEMEAESLSFIAIVQRGGRETLRLGDPTLSRLPATARLRLPATAAPLEELRVNPDDRSLDRDIGRVMVIHLLVGLTLAIAFYRMGARPLNQALSEIEATQAQLLHSDRLSGIGEMYAGLTHEINNPLGILLARVKLMLASAREGRQDQALIADLESIERHGTRIAGILRSLLAFARKTDFRLEEVDLNRIVRDVVALVERPFAKQGVRVEMALGGGLPHIQASPAHLQQVFLNLFNNARDAMPAGGRLTCRTLAQDDTVVAEVLDQGTGLAAAARERLFEPFFTTKDVGKGTGLGLSVSYGIVTAHGGEIEAENPPEGGALFRLRLPVGGERT